MTKTPWVVLIQPVLDELKKIHWLQPDGNPDPEWQLFKTHREAWNVAINTGRSNSLKEAWGAASDSLHDDDWGDAWEAVWDSAWNLTQKNANGAAQDVAFYLLLMGICADLPIAQKHRDYAKKRMNVWRKGYSLLCDVDGVLYVYERVEAQS